MKRQDVRPVFALLFLIVVLSLTKARADVPFECAGFEPNFEAAQDTFHPYRPGPAGTRAKRDLEFQWSSKFRRVPIDPNTGILTGDSVAITLDKLGKMLADTTVANPYGAEFSDIRLGYNYFRDSTAAAYVFNLGVGDSVPFIIGENVFRKDQGHIDVYVPTAAQEPYGHGPSTFLWKNEDLDTGHSACFDTFCVRHSNSINVPGVPSGREIDVFGQDWTGPSRMGNRGTVHEFEHLFLRSGSPSRADGANWPLDGADEFWASAAEVVTGVPAMHDGVDVPYGRSLIFPGSYETWRHLAAYIAFNFRGSDTTAAFPSGGTVGFADDLLWQWSRRRTYMNLRELLSDGTCGDCNGFFGSINNHDRLQLLLHNWQVASYVNNATLAAHQFGYPPQFGFAPSSRGAWQNINNNCPDDSLWAPVELVARPAWVSRDTTIEGVKATYVCSDTQYVSHTVLKPFSAQYWVIKSHSDLESTTQDLVIEVAPEGLARVLTGSANCIFPGVEDGRLMATLISYSTQTGNLWQHPEWADSTLTTQWVDVDSIAGGLEFVLPRFGGTHKAAVLIVSLTDGAGAPNVLGFPKGGGAAENLPDLKYRLSLGLRKQPYESTNPLTVVQTSAVSDESPDWGPSGEEIVFRSQIGGSYTQVYKKRLDGGSASVVYAQSANQDHPDWSLRGDRIAFDSEAGSADRDVWVYDTLTAGAQAVTSGGALDVNYWPSFRPDGQVLAYVHKYMATGDTTYNLALMNVDGTGAQAIGPTSRMVLKSPRWSPDGQFIYFSRNDSILAVSSGGGSPILPSDTLFRATTFDLPSGSAGVIAEQPKAWQFTQSCAGSVTYPFMPIRRVATWDTTSDDVRGRYYKRGWKFYGPRWSNDNTRVVYAAASDVSPSDLGIYAAQLVYDHAPVFGGTVTDAIATPGASFSMSLSATDPDGDALTYSGAFLPSGSSISGSTFTWTSPPVNCADRYVVFRATDPGGAVAQKVVKISTRPAVVANLSRTMGNHKAVLTWEEPDQGSCNADKYEVRRSTSTITDANYGSAAFVDSTVTPGSEGTTHCLEIDLSAQPCGAPYTQYFALKTRRGGLWSAVSSVVSGTPSCSGSAPFCDEEGLMAGGGGGGEESAVAGGLGEDSAIRSLRPTDTGSVSESNSFLWGVTGEDVTDLMRVASMATDTSLSITVGQSGDRKALLDRLSLGIVDHAEGLTAVAGDESVYVGTSGAVTGVTSAQGGSLTGALGESYLATAGEEMFVALSGSGRRTLMVESRNEPGIAIAESLGIAVQRRSGESWTTIGTIRPRREFASFGVDADGADTLRLVFLRSYFVRSISQLATSSGVMPQALELSGAEHSRLGSVNGLIASSDTEGAELRRGDELTLTFAAEPVEVGLERETFLIAAGRFTQGTSGHSSEYQGSAHAFLTAAPVWQFALGAARPNPSMGNVTISYTLAKETPVLIRVYDVAGRLVKTLVSGPGSPGPHDVTWDASDDRGRRVGSGVYFYRMDAGAWRSQRKVVFIER